EEFIPQDTKGAKVFTDLDQGLAWADVCYLVRIQAERHAAAVPFNSETYSKRFGINRDRLKHLGPQALILHPGPANLGIEMTADVYQDPRSRIRSQVENGFYIRAAL